MLIKIAPRSLFKCCLFGFFFLGGKNIKHFYISISAVGAFARFRLSCVMQRAWRGLLDSGLRDQRSALILLLNCFVTEGKSIPVPSGVFFSVNEAKNIFSAFVKRFEIHG